MSYPLTNYLNCDKFSWQHRIFLAALHEEREPTHFSEVVQDVRWRDAMTSEIDALQRNGTWDITPLPVGKKSLGCKWIYKIKYHSDGSVDRFKARLVVLGNHQVEGIDYDETFAPIAKMVTIRTVLQSLLPKIGNSIKWTSRGSGVHETSTRVLAVTKWFGVPSPQAPRCWFSKLSNALDQYGFQRSQSNHSLFIFQKEGVQLVVLVYVDDLIIAGNHGEEIATFKSYLHQCFHMKLLGKLKYFLGVEVALSPTGLFLCQRKYALDIIAEVGLLGGKPVFTPIEENHRLALATGDLLSDPSQYRHLVGRLIYLCFTRPELSCSVHVLSQFMQQPREEHWRAALRMVRYLKGQPGQGVLLKRESDLRLYGWCDSDWATCPLTCRSITGWIVFLGQSPISWKTKKQHTVSRSSAEAEYRSMANTTCELKWLQGLLLSLGIPHSVPMNLYCDNQAALHIAKNPVFHERTKHIEVDCHLIRDEIQQNRIQPTYVSTYSQLANLFTKPLGVT
ncbi:hypothetical protein V8G54_006400 [Vigna mungo]|uniref:Reverse transcriptase Ty1/copia-type domain-containing protein n=1 Tax=Vigna mungo TaxID=3915 RepID=A0AAQ3P0F0_VIGMU